MESTNQKEWWQMTRDIAGLGRKKQSKTPRAEPLATSFTEKAFSPSASYAIMSPLFQAAAFCDQIFCHRRFHHGNGLTIFGLVIISAFSFCLPLCQLSVKTSSLFCVEVGRQSHQHHVLYSPFVASNAVTWSGGRISIPD